jgi:hypothetical protein
MFKLIDDIKEISENINSYISIYPGAGTGIGNVEFSEKYEVSVERAGREAVINMKNSARPQSSSKRRKLIRLKELNVSKINLKNDLETIRIDCN